MPSLAADGPDAVEKRRARAEVDRCAPRRLHLADRDQLIAERFERLHDRLELEVAPLLLRMPGVGEHAVRHVDRAEPERRVRRRARRGRERRHHRVQQGQRDRGTEGTVQERAAGQMLLRDDHGYSTLARATLLTVSPGSSLVRIWNGALSTMPMMIDAQAIVVLRRLFHDAPNDGHIGRFDPAAQGVGQHPFGERRDERIGPAQDGVAQRGGPIDLGSVRQHAGGVDRRAIGACIAPLPHRIEVLERKARRIDDAMAGRRRLDCSGAAPAAPAPSSAPSRRPCCFPRASARSAAAEAAACSGTWSG